MNRYWYFLVLVSFLFSCSKNDDVNIIYDKVFKEEIIVKDTLKKYSIKDTIWFEIIPDSINIEENTGEKVNLRNTTYILSGVINLLKPQYDSLVFIDRNFDVVEKRGNILLINILNATQSSYSFDVEFGELSNTNSAEFGIITDYPGIFAIDFEGLVFYGENRTQYDDFSIENKGHLDLIFGNEDTNDSIYNSLPSDYKYKYDSYYNKRILKNKVYFIEVNE